ncbi:putative dipeptide and tripeptide permease YjdL [Piscirickettsia salmonis]|uniref:peptide MFS transporter n=1 Tax=Piscirickettsia salmonis TaxID=1238 RepID=UPI0012B76845|nr:oligopeptide:H+ symporter [Piscirickettsia salmonis]QGP49569.1 putative dipeptide and tripeptide permease YjdL [Piscirickettsia salmonis]
MRLLQVLPKGVSSILFIESCELFGRFGITALLVFYLKQSLGFSDAHAFLLYTTFVALFSATPALAGLFIGRYINYHQAALMGIFFMMLGNLLLVVPEVQLVYLSLALIAVGFGFFYPGLTTLLGRLYDRSEHGRDAGFTLYYMARNIGALFAPIICGFIGQAYGYHYAFLLSSLVMMIGFFFYFKMHGNLAVLVDEPASHPVSFIVTLLSAIIAVAVLYTVLDYHLVSYLIAACVIGFLLKIGPFIKQHMKVMLIIFALMFFAIIFSGSLGQGGTTLNLFIMRMVDRHMFGMEIPPSVYYALDPVFMMIIGPILAIVYTKLAKRQLEPGSLYKCMMGLISLSVGFGVFILAAQHAMQLRTQVSSLYIVIAFIIFPLAELFIMPVALSMITKISPKELTAALTGMWMLSQSVGSLLTNSLSKLGAVNFEMNSPGAYVHAGAIYSYGFTATALLLLGAGLLMGVGSYLLQRRSKSMRQLVMS